jgi:hypothetical protein
MKQQESFHKEKVLWKWRRDASEFEAGGWKFEVS